MNRIGFFAAIALVIASTADAQTRRSVASYGASNTDYMNNGTLFVPFIDSRQSTDGSLQSFSYNDAWSGIDGAEDPQTMSFSGFSLAQGDYGILRTSASGTLSNTFYNAENTPFHNTITGVTNPNGVPDLVNSRGYAQWTDKLAFGSTANNYFSTWILRVTGNNSGLNARSQFQIKIGSNATRTFNFQALGAYEETLRVSDFILGGIQEDVSMTLTSNVDHRTQWYAEGSTLTGSSDFGNTIVLEGIEVRDSLGNLVSDIDVVSASGTQYTIVPEPFTVSALAVGLFGISRRKRRGN